MNAGSSEKSVGKLPVCFQNHVASAYRSLQILANALGLCWSFHGNPNFG